MVVGRDMNGHAQRLDGISSDDVDGLTKKTKIGVKEPCCRPSESQVVTLGNFIHHATPLQPTFHSIEEFLAACWSITDQVGVVSILQQVKPPLAFEELIARVVEAG